MRVLGLKKSYTSLFSPPVVAVRDVSFGVSQGEVFALLGTNGAGKSTIFKSLTRDVVPTEGDVKIMQHSVLKEFSKARKYIGYCP